MLRIRTDLDEKDRSSEEKRWFHHWHLEKEYFMFLGPDSHELHAFEYKYFRTRYNLKSMTLTNCK